MANLTILTQSRPFFEEVLIGRQMAGSFKGKQMAPGGKDNPGENPYDAARREIVEETGLTVHQRDLRQVGVIRSYFSNVPKFEVNVFRAYRYSGTLCQTPTFLGEWNNTARLPWDQMLLPDIHWLWSAIANKWFGRMTVYFGPTCNTVEQIVFEPQHEERLPQR